MGSQRKFSVGDSVIPLTGVYRGDVGTIIDTNTMYLPNPKNPEKPLTKVQYIVRLDDNVVRKYWGADLEHP